MVAQHAQPIPPALMDTRMDRIPAIATEEAAAIAAEATVAVDMAVATDAVDTKNLAASDILSKERI